MKTFLRWPGNKSKYLKYIVPCIPQNYNTYIEPFLGSGALFLYLQPNKWIINDLNKDLISIWKLVSKNPELIIKRFKKFEKQFVQLSNDDKLIYCRNITDKLNQKPDKSKTEDRSINILFMMYCCYMGQIYHKDKYYFNGLELNISAGNRYGFFEKTYYENILNVSQFLLRHTIYNMDYKNILSKSRKGDFVFLDPPYIEKNVDYKFKYNKDEILNTDFIQELYRQVKLLDKKGVLWLMTQADTPIIRQVFREYTIKKFPVFRARTVSSKYELIIMNYKL